MKNLLIVIQHIRRGGPEQVAINYAEFLDKSKYKISFLLINPYEDEDEKFEQELIEKGYKIFKMPKENNSYLSKYLFLDKFFESNSFDIVHSHVIFFSGLVLRAAAKHRVPVRASHSHIVRWNREENLLYKCYTAFMRILLKKYSNLKFACSTASGKFLYGDKEYIEKGIFIPNGIETERFKYDDTLRISVRDEFNIKDSTYLVGHVGTVYEIKNQTFLVRVFSEILKKKPDSVLMLVGQVVDDEPVKKVVNELNLSDKVIFTGSRADINKFYSAFDIMIFPSLFEALPVSLIEAQASYLPCLISDTVTEEVKFNDNVEFMSLKEQPLIWAESALKLCCLNRNKSVENLTSVYDINNVVILLDKLYSK